MKRLLKDWMEGMVNGIKDELKREGIILNDI